MTERPYEGDFALADLYELQDRVSLLMEGAAAIRARAKGE